jgi:REP element-mobilizing transposase RayT
MGRPLRRQLAETVYLVTNRTLEERFWLKPTAETRKVLGTWLAYAAQRFGVELYAFVVMSNHVHLLLRAPLGNLADFMGYWQANAAKGINRLHGRRGPLWQRRYSAEPVLDTEALLDRAGYVMANPVLAHLVARPEQWPGLSSFGQLLGQPAPEFQHFRASAWHAAGCPADRGPFQQRVRLSLARLPGLEHLPAARYQQRLRAAVELHVEAARCARQQEGRTVMRRAALEAIRPSQRPARPKRSPRPLCHTTSPALWAEYRTQWRAFVEAYRQAAPRYCDGDVTATFPLGSFPPSRHPRARCFVSTA